MSIGKKRSSATRKKEKDICNWDVLDCFSSSRLRAHIKWHCKPKNMLQLWTVPLDVHGYMRIWSRKESHCHHNCAPLMHNSMHSKIIGLESVCVVGVTYKRTEETMNGNTIHWLPVRLTTTAKVCVLRLFGFAFTGNFSSNEFLKEINFALSLYLYLVSFAFSGLDTQKVSKLVLFFFVWLEIMIIINALSQCAIYANDKKSGCGRNGIFIKRKKKYEEKATRRGKVELKVSYVLLATKPVVQYHKCAQTSCWSVVSVI